MKPLNYYAFALKLKRALKRVQKRDVPSILLPLPDGVKKMSVQQIHYVEVQNHMVHYHTEEGEFVMRGSLQSAERNLPKEFFVKCNHWYLVNLMHVKEVRKNILTVAEYQLEISRRNRAAFMKALTEYMGGNS